MEDDKKNLEYAKEMLKEYQHGCFEALFMATQLELFLRHMYQPFKNEDEYKTTFPVVFKELVKQLQMTNKAVLAALEHVYGEVSGARIPVMYAHAVRMTTPVEKSEVKE